MIRIFPKSLFGQTLLVLLAGLVMSNLVGWWFYAGNREQAVRAVGGFALAQRIANLTRLVRDAPPPWRERIVSDLSDPGFRVALSNGPPQAPAAGETGAVAQAIKNYLVDQLSLGATGQPRVSASLANGAMSGGWHRMMGPAPMMHRFGNFGPFGGFFDLRVAVPLSDGQWLSFSTALPKRGPGFSREVLVSMGLTALIILVVSVWAVRRVTSPLASLSTAAERLGRDLNAPAMDETGTRETRQAARAFNVMQSRLRALIENRTRMLAAISHDLRTPLTLLRLRAENIDDAAQQKKILATIDEMDTMVAETLQFARDETTLEPRRRTDLTALLASAVDDLADAGLPVVMTSADAIVYDCQPTALKRALGNLLDNAVKYGKRASVAIARTPRQVTITIDDEGPGIPQEHLARAFEPFYRVEDSRNRDSGGIGLGLAIALSIVQAHGGELTLTNRPEGGLRARVTLPLQS